MALAGAEEPGDNGNWSRVTHSSVISVPEDQELLTLGALPTENYIGSVLCSYVMCGSGAGEVS